MFFIYGWGHRKSKDYGPVLKQRCERCKNKRYWHLTEVSRWITVFFIPVFPYSREHFLLCPVCGYGDKVSGEELDELRQIEEANRALAEKKITPKEYKNKVKNDMEAPRIKELGIKSSSVDSAVKSFKKSSKSKTKKNLLLICLVAGVLGIAIFLSLYYYLKHNVKVYLLNGFEEEMAISVDEKEIYSIPPQSYQLISIPEGYHSFSVSRPVNKEISSEFKLNIFDLFLNRYFFAVNPNAKAILIRESIDYVSKESSIPLPDSDDGYEFEFLWGEIIRYWDEIDYKFEEFPESIKTDDGDFSVTKDRMDFYDLTPIRVAVLILSNEGEEKAIEFLECYIDLTPEDIDLGLIYLGFVSGSAENLARAEKFLTERLDENMEVVNFHRLYQDVISTLRGEDELIETYDELLESDPNNPDYLYLRGRVEPDIQEAIKFYDRALQNDSRHIFASYAKGGYLSNRGEFEQAKAFFDIVVSSSEYDWFKKVQEEILIGLGEWDTLIQEVEKELEESPEDYWLVSKKIKYLIGKGEVNEAKELAIQYSSGMMETYGYSNLIYLNAWIGELTNDMNLFGNELIDKNSEEYSPYYHFKYLVMTRQLDAAGSLFENSEDIEPSPEDFMVLAVGYLFENNRENQEKFLLKTIEEFKKSKDSNFIKIVELLESDNISVDMIYDVRLSSVPRSLIALYFAKEADSLQDRNVLLNVSKDFNYMLEFPRSFISEKQEVL